MDDALVDFLSLFDAGSHPLNYTTALSTCVSCPLLVMSYTKQVIWLSSSKSTLLLISLHIPKEDMLRPYTAEGVLC